MRRSRRVVLAAVGSLGVAAAIAVPLIAGGGGSKTAAPPSIYEDPRALDLHPAAGSFEPDDTTFASCDGGDQGCLEQAFGNLAYTDGPEPALKTFEERMASDPAVESNCHRIAHTIGSASLARYEGDVAQAFARGDSTCWSGYYHGILERSFAPAKTPQKFLEIARSVCAGAELRASLWLTYQCVHGLGHGLMIQSGYNLPFSLKICDRLAGSWDQTSCTGGVFMENIAAGQTSAYQVKSPWLKDDDLVYPCNAVAQRHKLYCYWMVTSRVLQANGFDWKATAKICAGVEKDWVNECFESYGRDASGTTRQNAREILELCALAGAGERDCIYGAARDITSNDAGGKRTVTLCNSAPARHRAYCFYGLGTIVGTLELEAGKRLRTCEALTREYAADCIRGSAGQTF